MDLVCAPAVLDILADHESIRLLASIGKQRAETETSVKFFIDPAAVSADSLHRLLQVRLRSWIESKSEPSQRHFWNFFDEIRSVSSAYNATYALSRYALHELTHLEFSLPRRKCTFASSQVVVDGQCRLAAYENANRDLSSRAIRSVLKLALNDLDNLENIETIWEVLETLNRSLVREVTQRVKWVARDRNLHLEVYDVPSTREWVLGFLFRTGNPPPRSGLCPADSRAFVTIITAAWREGYATVQGQKDSRSLRNTIRKRYTKARFNRSARSYASLGGVPQFAGRRRSRRHYPLAQCA
jgi:hypothetical protein